MSSYSELKERLKKDGFRDLDRESREPEEGEVKYWSPAGENKSSYQELKEKLQNNQERENSSAAQLRKKIGSNGISFKDVGVDEDYVNSFFTDAVDSLQGAQESIGNVTYSSAKTDYDSFSYAFEDLNARARYVRSFINANKNKLSEEQYNNFMSFLDGFDKDSQSVVEAFKGYNDFYGQFKTEEDYNKYLEDQEYYNKLLSVDLEQVKKDLDLVEEIYNDPDGVDTFKYGGVAYSFINGWDYYKSGHTSPIKYEDYLKADDGNEKNGTELFYYNNSWGNSTNFYDKLKEFYEEASKVQELETIKNNAKNASDYELYVEKGLAIKNPTYSDATGASFFGWYPFADDINNIATFMASEENWRSVVQGNDEDRIDPKYHFMTEDEVKIYSYYLAKGDTKNANKFLNLIDNDLRNRQAYDWAGRLDGNIIASYTLAFASGLDSFSQGVESLFSDTPSEPTVNQLAGSIAREDLSDVGGQLPDWLGGGSWGQVGYDLVNTTSNMLPSILVGTINPIAGAATMGVSAAGNAKNEMLKLGYSNAQATTYGILVGASEAGLQYALGGISKLGGKASGGLVNTVANKVDNAFARVAIKVGGNMLAEASEEAIQTILEPFFKSIATGSFNFESADIDEVLYSALLGAITAGVLEGGSTIYSDVSTSQAGQAVKNAGLTSRLAELGSTFAADSVAYQIAGKVNENTGAYTIGRLLNEVGATLTEQNMSEIILSLERKHFSNKDAKTIAKWLYKAVEGEYFTDKQIAMLENNNLISDTFRDVVVNQNSTVNQRLQGYSEFTQELKASKKPAASPEIQANSEQEATKEVESVNPQGNIVNSQEGAETEARSDVTTYNGEEVSIVDFDPTKSGVVTVRRSNGDTESVSTKDLDLSERDYLIVKASTEAGMSAESANEMLHGFNAANSSPDLRNHISAEAYYNGFTEAYRYGTYGYPASEMSQNGFSASLSEEQRKIAYNRGRIDSESSTKSKQASVDKKVEDAKESKNKKYEGEVKLNKGIDIDISKNDPSVKDAKNLDIRRDSLKFLNAFNKTFSKAKIRIFASYVNKDGVRVYKNKNGAEVKAPNGMYFEDGSIAIDLNAGKHGEGLILFTVSHELTHRAKVLSPQLYKEYADFLFEHYGKNHSVEELVQAEIDRAKRNRNIDLTYDEAYDEAVAHASEAMLVDCLNGTAQEKIAELQQTKPTLWKKIKDFFTAIIAKIKALYKTLEPESKSAQIVRQMGDVAEQLQAMWLDMIIDSGNAQSAIGETLSNNGIVVDPNTESASLMSVRDLLDSKQQKKVVAALVERFGVTEQEAKGWISAETSLASVILNPKYSQYLDYTADPDEMAIKSNSDYPQGTVDFSNICKKRRDFTDVMNRVLRKFPNHVFEATDLAKIRTIMMDEGMEVACGICYVEDRRQLDSIVAQDFINSLDLYRKGSKTRPDGKPFNTNQLKALKLIDGDTYTPSIYELISLEGRNALKAKNPAMEEAWVKFNNARGMQSVRLLLNDAEYKRQILKYSPTVVARKNDLGGLRIYSFSDMEMFHLIDIIQVITDSAAVGLSIQGYTKVNEYAKAVKDTGEKLNRSLIPKGDLGYHIEDGKVVLDFDTVEGIDISHPDFFDSTDNPNVGNIVIGINATQIRAAMTSKFIDQIIPFHTGQSNEVLGEKGIAAWVNYKDFQSERDIKTEKKSAHQINIYTEVIKAAEQEGKPITNKVEFVNKFLEVCKENNLIPRFSEFLDIDENGDYIYTEGYHKFLVDFKTFDQNTGEYLPQKPVKPIFDNKYLTKLLKDYVKSQQVKDAQLAESIPAVIERVTNEIVKPNSKTMLSDRDSEGNTLTKEQREFFKDSKIRDENGNLLVLYHGTNNEFYTFDKARIKIDNLGRGFYFVDKKQIADSYAQRRTAERGGQERVVECYLLVKKPFDTSSISYEEMYDFLVYDYNRRGRVRYDYRKKYGIQQVEADKYAKELLGDEDIPIVNGKKDYSVLFSTSETNFQSWLGERGYDGLIVSGTDKKTNINGTAYIVFDSNQIKSTSNKTPTSDPDIRYDDRDLAPTFYSQMGKVIEGMKQEKFAANSVVNMLRGRGVKAEEIRWSGIVPFLENKKSVTKQELLDFINSSQLQIGEQMSGKTVFVDDDGNAYNSDAEFKDAAYAIADQQGIDRDRVKFVIDANDGFAYAYVGSPTNTIFEVTIEGDDSSPRWLDYKLKGGTNYREIVFTMPNSTYTNRAMRGHWGEDAEGVLVHARIQDFIVNGKKMLFIEEIQSDWHNEGHQKGYLTDEYEDAVESHDKLYNEYKKLDLAFHKYVRSNEFMTDPEDVRKKKHDWLRGKAESAQKKYLDAEKVVNSLKEKGAGDTPDAPFRDNYHEYVLKRLLRMAAEHGYDSIGWTPADIQSQRWSEDYAEGYRIEYDQDIPKFLKKYGRQWGATVGNSYLNTSGVNTDIIDDQIQDIERDIEQYRDELLDDPTEEYEAFIQEGISDLQNSLQVLYKKRQGEKVWSMELTDSMKDTVLHEGQVLYDDRDTSSLIGNDLIEYKEGNAKPDLTLVKVRNERTGKIETTVKFVGDKPAGYIPEKIAYCYKLFEQHPDGTLHALFAGASNATPVGEWQYAKGFPYTDKGVKGMNLRERYGWHLSAGLPSAPHLMSSKDFDRGYPAKNAFGHPKGSKRVWVRMAYDASTDFNSIADSTTAGDIFGLIPFGGYYAFKENNQSEWVISSAVKIDKILTEAERQQILQEAGYDEYEAWRKKHYPTDAEKAESKRKSAENKKAKDKAKKEGRNYLSESAKEMRESIKSRIIDNPELQKTRFSERDDDSMSNRSLLANALETATKNDIEKNKLAQYKEKIGLINSEEQHLHEINEQIHNILFTKGARDNDALNKLKFEQKQTESRINTYDKQLLTLEASKPLKAVLEREKRLAYKKAEQRGKEAVAAARERFAKTTRELLDRHQESRKKGIDSRHRTDMRHEIKDVVKELNQYLLDGTKEKHVPIGLQKPVAAALAVVNMDTVNAEARIAELEKQLMKAKTPEKIQEISKKIENVREMGGRMDEKLQALRDAYDKILNSDDPLIANSHDEVISNTIQSVIEDIGDTPLRDMTLSQLEEVYDMYRMVLHTIRNANKAFKAAKNESIAVLANRVMEEIDTLKKKDKLEGKLQKAVGKYNWNNQKPVYAFERIGSKTLTERFNAVRAGEDTWATDVSEARDFYREQHKKYNYDSWDFHKRFAFTSSSGKAFELTLDQIMSLYAYSKRAQAGDHLKRGGFVFDPKTEVVVKTKAGIKVKKDLNDATAYNLSDGTLADIISKLTPDQKAFVDVMQDYLSSTMGEKGNEVSLALYDIKMFKEKNYFPLKSAPQYMAIAKEKAQGETKIKNSGFTKETVKKASNPVVLTSFMDVWANHVNEMSMYHAFVLPMEDMYRVYNYKTPTSEDMPTESVEMYIQNAHGEAATNYIDQLLKDLNGGAVTDPRESAGKAWISRFKKASVMASLSVVIQQPTAIIRAMALVDAKHFGIAPITRGIFRTINSKKHKALWSEVKKYAPVAIIKEMGYFDTNMGRSATDYITAKEYNSIGAKIKGFFTDSAYRDEKLSRLPALADEMGWVAIWEAVKRETVAKYPDLQPNSEAFMKKVSERFTEVVTKTQVYDSVLARSGFMRSKSALVNMWTSFMGEPTTSLNMLQDAIIKGKRGDKKYAAKAFGAVYGSILLNAALVSLVYAMRDDDEDETFTEKYLSSFTTELLDGINPITYLPFFKDIWSIAQGFDVERTDTALFTDLLESVEKVSVTLAQYSDDMDEEELEKWQSDLVDALWSVVDNISSLAGLPVKNVRRDINGLINFFKTITNGQETTWGSLWDKIGDDIKDSLPIVGRLPDETKADKLYDAIMSGDTEYVERLKSGYKDESAYNTALRKALRENDPRIRQAAQARANGDTAEYMRIAREIIAEGNFSQDNIVAAINAEVNAIKNSSGSGSSDSTKPNTNKVESIFKVEDYYSAIVGRDQATANIVKEDIIKAAMANGKDRDEAESNFNSQFTSHIRDEYERGYISSSDAREMLINYGGKSAEEAQSKIQYWDFKLEYPDYDLTESAVTKYYEEVEPYGIGVDTYYDYSEQRSKCKGTDNDGDGKTDSGSVKVEVMRVIDSLPLTSAQKDVLYYLNGWSASTIWEAPWH